MVRLIEDMVDSHSNVLGPLVEVATVVDLDSASVITFEVCWFSEHRRWVGEGGGDVGI